MRWELSKKEGDPSWEGSPASGNLRVGWPFGRQKEEFALDCYTICFCNTIPKITILLPDLTNDQLDAKL